ncbi:MAG: hypothetical protein M3Y74_04805, partial [Chloroflexota bacterium]|nr:hypothetical protein [Chloroflexota bacterium]
MAKSPIIEKCPDACRLTGDTPANFSANGIQKPDTDRAVGLRHQYQFSGIWSVPGRGCCHLARFSFLGHSRYSLEKRTLFMSAGRGAPQANRRYTRYFFGEWHMVQRRSARHALIGIVA